MQIDERLLKEITRLVIEELSKVNNSEAKNKDRCIGYFREIGPAKKGQDIREVVIGIGPAFGESIKHTINGIEHKDVIKEIMAGIEEEGMIPRIVKIYKTSDVAFIGKEAAILSGSGIGIGIQSKGTAIIHQKDLYPLTNLELFSQAPLLTLKDYRDIGKNAARYAKGVIVKPISIRNDFMSRPKYQVKAAVMHIKETEKINKNYAPIELKLLKG
ncbi:propanediol/glycerol family dehydratase medium subunit [Caloramator sp. E03]|uniref:propanediol/glycerol family dehydratase medium subunit n=1 Tax=Caloramator sp. E03 TaxID=2576307 RepID=UPI0011102803|nr:propanediol/glycerol family dehydratase medium subunit [Caloramator sp. E03]QCX33949.1 propanediol/glycerol family dehydratase medium subunit [Caloramator sp. E03]